MKHLTVHPTPAHQRTVVLQHEIFNLPNQVEIDTWLDKKVNTIEDARKVLGVLIAAMGHLVNNK